MDDFGEKTDDSASITREEEGYVSATEEFPLLMEELSSLEDSIITSKLLVSPERQEGIMFIKGTELSEPVQSRVSLDHGVIVKKRQETPKNSPLPNRKTIELTFTEEKWNENHLEKDVPLIDFNDSDSYTEILKQHRDLIVSSLEKQLKALVQEMVERYLPYKAVSEKIQNVSLFPKLLRDPNTSEENLQATLRQHASSIPCTRYVQQNIDSEINSKRTRGIYSDTFNTRNSKNNCKGRSPKRQCIPPGSPKASTEKYSKRSRPLLLKYTDGINGCTKELLICTTGTIVDSIHNNPKGKQTDIIQSLLKTSKQYIGKPLHVIFNPRNVPEEANDDPVPLRPSPGSHDLFQTIQKCGESPKNIPPSNVKSLESFILLNSTDSCESLEETPSERKKLKIRSCRRKKSRTAMKRIDIKQVVSSVFKNIFHFYALLGGHLKSGSVITRFGSNAWLKHAGVAEDEHSLETASDVFTAVAGSKLVLNIFDYIKFLILYARKRRIVAAELLNRLSVCKLPQCFLRERLNWGNFRRGMSEFSLDLKSNSSFGQKRLQAHKQKWMRSLPTL